MSSQPPSSAELAQLMNDPERIRNVTVMAHVDHGKTSLTDSLIASNGIISERLAGKLRFMDSREDEQERGITMKMSSISLKYEPAEEAEAGASPYLINVIDSPGHVDFCSEVSSAVRLSDGALVVIDVVEGVRTQTIAVLRQAWVERLVPCLVLNKIDRLILELQMSTDDAYQHMLRIIEQVNAIAAMFHNEMVMEEGDEDGHSLWDAQDKMRSPFVFSPALGNVAFGCAAANWAFRVSDFALIISKRLGMNAGSLRKALWPEDGNDFYFNPKTKSVSRKDEGGKLKPMFVQFVLEQIWAVYHAFVSSPDEEKARKIVTALSLKMTEREIANKNREEALRSVMSRWLPLAKCILSMILEEMPSPCKAQKERMQRLIPSHPLIPSDQRDVTELEQTFTTCDPNAQCTMAFVSKMFAGESLNEQGEQKFIGFTRIFTGTLRVGDEIKVLGPRHNPLHEDDQHVSTAQVRALYILMGRDLLNVQSVPAGCICGVWGLEEHVLKYATLCSTRSCRPLSFMSFQAMPIVRVAVEPSNPLQHDLLVHGLQLLNRADPSVEVKIQETGEHVILASGEMHLERCLKDLRELFAKIDIHVSAPLVQFKETLIDKKSYPEMYSEEDAPRPHPRNPVTSSTANRLCDFSVRALPLPRSIRRFLVLRGEELRAAHADLLAGKAMNEETRELLKTLRDVFMQAEDGWEEEWKCLWALGPKHVGPNILLCHVEGFHPSADWIPPEFFDPKEHPPGDEERLKLLSEMESSAVTGFQICSLAGPLCEEPMEGVAFVVEAINLNGGAQEIAASTDVYGPWSGQVISAMREACRNAFLMGERRLVEALFDCDVQTTADMLGKAYAVLNKRRAKVVEERMKDGTDIFVIEAKLPVVESFGLVDELRKNTSGSAQCQLVMAGWEVMPFDPFWEPNTEEELEDSDLSDVMNARGAARKCMDLVRKRKGLPVEEKLVQHAEKQRTRSRRK